MSVILRPWWRDLSFKKEPFRHESERFLCWQFLITTCHIFFRHFQLLETCFVFITKGADKVHSLNSMYYFPCHCRKQKFWQIRWLVGIRGWLNWSTWTEWYRRFIFTKKKQKNSQRFFFWVFGFTLTHFWPMFTFYTS